MFQVNQACSQFVQISGGSESLLAEYRWVFGAVVAVLVGVVIIGAYYPDCERDVPSGPVDVCDLHFRRSGCTGEQYRRHSVGDWLDHWPGVHAGCLHVGGLIGALLVGIQRGTFSNEAGIGSAPIAHAAVKTTKPASEGVVALLEPFIDTVVVCSLTALVIVVTGNYGEALSGANGIEVTSQSFESVISWFPFVLFVAVTLFAFSTLLSWSYYGQQAWTTLFGGSRVADITYKLIFCACIIVGAALSLGAVTDFSDGMLLGMCFPNLIGVYVLLPVVKQELVAFRQHASEIDAAD